MNAIEVIIGIIFFAFFAFPGYWLVSRAKKNNPESTRETAKELINGIMGGAIVAIIVIASETSNYPFFRLSLAIGLLFFLVGLAYWLGSLNKK